MSAAPAEILRSLFDAAVAGAQPRDATARAVGRSRRLGDSIWGIALGKAAGTMAAGAVDGLRALGREPSGGVVIGADAATPPPPPSLEALAGAPPLRGPRSLAAAERLAAIVARVRAEDSVLVLLSGGASSLAGAPIGGVSLDDLTALHERLLTSGAEIGAINAVRKRFSRWGAGRLAAALAPARVTCLVVSDVVGDDLAAIGSGPCVGDATTAPGLIAWLRGRELWDALPATMAGELEAVARGERPETPKPADAVFRRVTARVVLRNAHALRAAAARASSLGVDVVGVRGAMRGEAARRGEAIVKALAASRLRHASVTNEVGASGAGSQEAGRYACFLWGGETTVTIERVTPGALGGRCQELALSAARALYVLGGTAEGVTLLAAGTDGRDGPTDAAGAIVDDGTWSAVRAAGRDPARDLAAHDAYHALDAAGALLRTGLTGTNVTDIVIALVDREARRAAHFLPTAAPRNFRA